MCPVEPLALVQGWRSRLCREMLTFCILEQNSFLLNLIEMLTDTNELKCTI